MDNNTRLPALPPVRCDWLDVTFPTECALGDDVSDFLAGLNCSAKRVRDSVLEFRLPGAEWGNIQFGESSQGWSRLSASGGSCEALRQLSAFGEYLALLGSYPHSVTRLDACMDVPLPGPAIVGALVKQYPPDSLVRLSRKGVRPDYNLQPSLCGGITGTFYAGPLRYGKAKISARVYDKQAEVLSRTGHDIGALTRYEVTARKGVGASLRDASRPLELFWHIASPALLARPAAVPPWTPFLGETWAPGAIPRASDRNRLLARVESSVDFGLLIEFADRLGADGRRELFRMVRHRLGLHDIAIP